jgi:hypothetical protein
LNVKIILKNTFGKVRQKALVVYMKEYHKRYLEGLKKIKTVSVGITRLRARNETCETP